MQKIVRWTIDNSAGMNVLLIAVLLIGGWATFSLRREVFPEFELEIIMVSVPFPGATPEDVESGILEKIEEVVRPLDGVKRVNSIAQEGAGFVLIELHSNVGNVQKVLSEVDREVARISSFPELAEDPQIQQIVFRDTAIRIAVLGPESGSFADSDSQKKMAAELELREVAEKIREGILKLPAVSTVEISGSRPYQIDVEIPERRLREHGLTLSQVANKLRRENVELPGGQLRAEGQEILLRAFNRGKIGEEIGKLPVISDAGGAILTVNDLGRVTDHFEDSTNISEINGRQALVINVQRTKTEDLLAMTDAVHKFVKSVQVPSGYELKIWGDTSVDVRDRIRLLVTNGLQGLMLVFCLLALFLELRVAFWVALGIPVSLLSSGLVLWYTGHTLNMLSLFAYLIVLGIVVDDAIVVSENVFTWRQQKHSLHDAAISGTVEVMPSVIGSVLTTIIAFIPLFFVAGVMGKFMAVIPVAVVATLIFSLLESALILPCHLAEEHNGFFTILKWLTYPLRPLGLLLGYLNQQVSKGLNWFAYRVYSRMLDFSLRHVMVPLSLLTGVSMITVGAIRSGIVPLEFFPKNDSNLLIAKVTFPDGTPSAIADAATIKISESLRELNRQLGQEHAALAQQPVETLYPDVGMGEHDRGPVKLIYRQVGNITRLEGPASEQGAQGSHTGQVFVELHDTTIRKVNCHDLIARWRKQTGPIAGVESLTFRTLDVGPGGRPIEFKLTAPAKSMDQLLEAVEVAKQTLAKFSGVVDVADDNLPGKWEYQFKMKEQALATGVTPSDLGEAVRNAYFGAEAMRIQRGRHEVKLMVRYPPEDRRNLGQFENMQIQIGDDWQRPITELAEVKVRRGFSEINRVDQQRSITVNADVDQKTGSTNKIVTSINAEFVQLLRDRYPDVSLKWEGQQQQNRESTQSLIIGFIFAMIGMFVLLVMQFKSYFQPVLILLSVPFGMIGAVWGHALLGLPITLFSMFGLVALAGVVVNDSIVLVDFINSRVRSGHSLRSALVECGRRRMRPVLLTSVTTIAGLGPLLMEKSFQAQLLIPMAASLAFGLAATTVLVLFIVPLFYLIYARIVLFLGGKGV